MSRSLDLTDPVTFVGMDAYECIGYAARAPCPDQRCHGPHLRAGASLGRAEVRARPRSLVKSPREIESAGVPQRICTNSRTPTGVSPWV
ncbi:hypothetical protein [Streptomyces sp. NBC_00829]|uniref:hypothetical protein n=1 Tax=Streptomyces sp. NBC_00829 TaxID=2903679 RepID=UPI00386FCF5E|nr:hypothetical protein OG293_07745 [Streptomyces sp. NBC_00829]